jgi:hypothetical protein
MSDFQKKQCHKAPTAAERHIVVAYSTAQGPQKNHYFCPTTINSRTMGREFLSSSQITLLSSLLQNLGFHANDFTKRDESHQTWGSSLLFSFGKFLQFLDLKI